MIVKLNNTGTFMEDMEYEYDELDIVAEILDDEEEYSSCDSGETWLHGKCESEAVPVEEMKDMDMMSL